MFRTILKQLSGGRPGSSPSLGRRLWKFRFLPAVEALCDRINPAVTASFTPGTGILSVFGDAGDNTITISRDAAGTIFVNAGAVAITGGTPTIANTAVVQVFGQDGNDQIALDEANGALPAANLFGGAGNDTLTGGSGADQLFGQAGNDTLLGKGGNDTLTGGDGDDVLTGGTGDDQVFGEAGNDRMIWNPGEGSDLNEGGDGIDTVEVNGGNGSETFTVAANGTRVRFDRTSPAPFFLDIGTSENLVLNANGGDDSFTAGNGLAGLIQITADGGAGNDTLIGGDGNDTLLGGDGNDLVVGGRGNDVAFLGAGDDTFTWNPGDGSDTIEGQAGQDTMLFNGANVNEKIDLSANGQRLRFTRDVANIVMDTDGIENVDFNALGGSDTITVNDLSGTAVTGVNLNLAGTLGGTTGDGAADTVIVNGTNGNDAITVTGDANGVSVQGLAARVNLTGFEANLDRLTINALDGNDVVNAAGLGAGALGLTADGGAGNDMLTGGAGNDTLTGGAGDDVLIGGPGVDVLDGGAGSNVLFQDAAPQGGGGGGGGGMTPPTPPGGGGGSMTPPVMPGGGGQPATGNVNGTNGNAPTPPTGSAAQVDATVTPGGLTAKGKAKAKLARQRRLRRLAARRARAARLRMLRRLAIASRVIIAPGVQG
jgi:Ca2+-binding RTX toxin-like protein